MQKILAIDDKKDNLVTLSALLKNLMPGCAVITAQSGMEGIEKAKAEAPDAILLDVKMPEMDGFETCRILMADESTRQIPVIMITAIKTDPQSRIKGMEIGANTFLAKPIDEVELVSQLKVALRIKKAEDALREERASLEQAVEERTAKLRESEERFRVAQEVSPDGFTILSPVRDANGRVVDFTWVYENATVASWNGTDPEAVVGKRLLELFPGHAGTQFMKAYQLVAETGKQIVLEDEYRGETIANSTWFRIIVVPTGHDIAILTQNITARKRTEEERQKFVMLADSSSEFIGMCDLNMQPLYVNPAGRRMVGLPDMEAACRVKVQDYYFPEDQKFIAEEFFPRVLREGHGEVEIRLRHFRTGEPIWMLYCLFHLRDAGGALVGWATVSRDITERKQAEEELQKLNAELEQRVADRTAELAAKAAELERVNKVFVGRELRMRELKEQIAELEKK